MVANSVKRREYDDLIVSFSGPRCDYSTTQVVTVPFPAAGTYDGRVNLRVLRVGRQAFRALAAIMLHYGYTFDETAGGTLNCRYIGGTTSTSFHAHGIAGDWNPSRNRYRRYVGTIQWGKQTDMPKAMVRAIESVRTVSGHPVFEWGGRWWNIKDPMHYELDVYRSRLTTGINLSTLPPGAWSAFLAFEKGAGIPPTQGEEMLYGLDIGKTGDPSKSDGNPGYRVLQAFLARQGFDIGEWGPNDDGVDGVPGDDSRRGLHNWKVANGITSALSAGEGKIGDYEMAAVYASGGTSGDTVDSQARKQAQAARNVANAALDGATRANKTLDKIRSE